MSWAVEIQVDGKWEIAQIFGKPVIHDTEQACKDVAAIAFYDWMNDEVRVRELTANLGADSDSLESRDTHSVTTPGTITRLSFAEILTLLDRIKLNGWQLRGEIIRGVPHLHWTFMTVSGETEYDPVLMMDWPKLKLQKARSWSLAGLSRTEIVRTAFLAARQAYEHELQEGFRFDGVGIYGPHFDVFALKAFAESAPTDAEHS